MSTSRLLLTGGIAAVLAHSLASGAVLAQSRSQDTARGSQKAPQVSPLEVVSPAVPIPTVGEGAPLFTVEELKSASETARKLGVEAASNARRCSGGNSWARFASWRPSMANSYNQEQVAQLFVQGAANRAAKASEKALAARVDAAAGKAGMAQVEAAELERQAAVKRFLVARGDAAEAGAAVTDLQELRLPGAVSTGSVRGDLAARAGERFFDGGAEGLVIGRNVQGMALTAIEVIEREDSRGGVLRIRGRVENQREGAMLLPSLTFTAVDRDGRALRSVTSDPARPVRIPAQGSVPFAYEFRPAPGRATDILVAFASDHRPPGRLPVGMYCR